MSRKNELYDLIEAARAYYKEEDDTLDIENEILKLWEKEVGPLDPPIDEVGRKLSEYLLRATAHEGWNYMKRLLRELRYDEMK